MSDQTITQSHASLKELNARLQKLTRAVDRFQVLQLQLSQIHQGLSDAMEDLDVIAFEVGNELAKINSSQIFFFPLKERL
jgi:hypothetical protein